MGLSRDRLRQERLTGSGRAYEKAALRKLGSDLGVFLRMLQELNRLLQGLLRLVLSRDILERDSGLGLHVHLRAALAYAHHASGSGHPAQDHAHQDPDQDQRGEAQHNVQDKTRRVVRDLLLELDIRRVEALYQIRVIDPSCVVGHLDALAGKSLLLCHDRQLVSVNRNRIDQVLVQKVEELVIGDLHRCGVVHGPVDNTHQDQRDQGNDHEDQYGRVVPVLIRIPLRVIPVVIIHSLLPVLSKIIKMNKMKIPGALPGILQFNIPADQCDAPVDPEIAGVNAEVVGRCVSPFLLRLEVIEGCSLLVRLRDHIQGLLPADMLILHDPVCAELIVRVDKHAGQTRVVPEYIVGCSSDDHTAALLADLHDGVVLRLVDLLLQGAADIIHGWIDIHHDGVKEAAGRLLVIVLKDLLADIALLRHHLQKFFVIERKPQFRRKSSPDFMSAASELSSDRYDISSCHLSTSESQN